MDPFRAELRVTSKELRTTGNIGRRNRLGSRTVFAADIDRLEFQRGTEWFATRRSGLYAVTAKRDLCILPFIDQQQTAEIIKTVENRFPGLKAHT